jgi:hypothetical protein
MPETLQAPKRRRVRFRTHQEIVDEARALAAQPTRQLGNWSLPDICQHLATAMDLCIDGDVPFRVPLRIRIVARLARRRILQTGLPTGFKLPEKAEAILYRKPQDMDSAIAALERGIARLKTTPKRVAHPALGKMNAAQWDLFHLRHAELHLSFIVPEDRL